MKSYANAGPCDPLCLFMHTAHLEMWLDNSIYSLIIQSVIMVCIFPVICMYLLKYSFKIIAA